MNSINEIKDMLDKLNEELETLRAENKALKLRLSKYESVAENDNIHMTIEEMDLSVRSYNWLKRHTRVQTVADILEIDILEMYGVSYCAMRNFGRKSLLEVVEKMETLGFVDWAKGIIEELNRVD